MLSMKNWHGNWLESVLDVLDMLFFCIMTLCGILFSLHATNFHSPLAWYFHIQTYVLLWQRFWKGAVKGNEPCNTPFYLLSRKIRATEIAFHWNEVYIDWFTNLVLLNCQVSNSWKSLLKPKISRWEKMYARWLTLRPTAFLAYVYISLKTSEPS